MRLTAEDRLPHLSGMSAETKEGQSGITLVELIIALLIIGIAMATITGVIVSSFDAIKQNTDYAASIRTAESCYETLLALHENNAWQWDDSQATPYPECDVPDWRELDISGAATGWLPSDPGRASILESACRNDNFPDPLECRSIDLDGPSTWFRIPVSEGSDVELLVPNDR